MVYNDDGDESVDTGAYVSSSGERSPQARVHKDGWVALENSGVTPRTQAGRAPRPPFRLSTEMLVGKQMLLHFGVLAFYLMLFIVWLLGAEQKVEVSLESATHLQTVINLINHIVMLLFSIAIVAVMQPISTLAIFDNLPQPLTTLSDRMTAWHGLGSSIVNLWHNYRFNAAFLDVFLITVYLATLSGLGISSSFIFNVPTVNSTETVFRPARPASIALEALLPPGLTDTPTDFSDVTFDWYMTSMSLQGNSFLNGGQSFWGMDGSRAMVFDSLSETFSPPHTGYADVNYTRFYSSCGSIPHASLSATAFGNISADFRLPILLTLNYTLGSEPMTLHDTMTLSFGNASDVANQLWYPSRTYVRVPDSRVIPGIGRNLILYNIYNGNVTGLAPVPGNGSRPILDSQNSTGPSWPLVVQRPDGAPPLTTGLMIQAIGCSVYTATGRSRLDATTNMLDVSADAFDGLVNWCDPVAVPSSWEADWQPDLTKSTKPEDMWASMFLPNNMVGLWRDQPVPIGNQWSCVDYLPALGANGTVENRWNLSRLQDMYQQCHVPTLIESVLTEAITGDDQPSYIPWLEWVLAYTTALTMWSATDVPGTLKTYTTTGPYSERDVITPSFDMRVTRHILVGRLSFNVYMLFVGMALAILMVVLGAYILGTTDASGRPAPIDDVTLLSLMTLDNSAIATRTQFAGVQSDGAEAQRRAGMFLVNVENHFDGGGKEGMVDDGTTVTKPARLVVVDYEHTEARRDRM